MNSTLHSGDAPQEFSCAGGDLHRESERLKLLLDMTKFALAYSGLGHSQARFLANQYAAAFEGRSWKK